MLSKIGLLALIRLSLSVAQISDDFESGWDQLKWPVYAPDCHQGGNVVLDSTTAHSGTSSLKVTSPGGYCGHVFFGNNASIPLNETFIRAWVKMETALTQSHVSFIVMPDATLGNAKHLRLGGMDEVMLYNRETDDATLPDMSPQGTDTSETVPAGSWQCLEYHISSTGLIETWLNGKTIAGLTVGPNASNPNANGWGTKYQPMIQGVYFGWESYGGDSNTLWWDDIVIAGSRVGCNTTITSPANKTLARRRRTT